MSFTFQIVLRPEPKGGFTVIVPSLPGCVTYGDSLEEAYQMAQEAIALYLNEMKDNDETIIDDTHTFDSRVQVIAA